MVFAREQINGFGLVCQFEVSLDEGFFGEVLGHGGEVGVIDIGRRDDGDEGERYRSGIGHGSRFFARHAYECRARTRTRSHLVFWPFELFA